MGRFPDNRKTLFGLFKLGEYFLLLPNMKFKQKNSGDKLDNFLISISQISKRLVQNRSIIIIDFVIVITRRLVFFNPSSAAWWSWFPRGGFEGKTFPHSRSCLFDSGRHLIKSIKISLFSHRHWLNCLKHLLRAQYCRFCFAYILQILNPAALCTKRSLFISWSRG